MRFTWLVLVLIACSAQPRSPSSPAEAPTRAVAPAAPKNIILLMTDGAALTQWEFGRYSSERLRKRGFVTTDVVLRRGTLGLMTTHPANAMVTDSAAAATAMSIGAKTNIFMLGVAPDGRRMPTLMEIAKAAGRRTGLVTTAQIYDATPAAFSVHAKHREEYQTIVDQYIELEPDVLIGSGADYFLPKPAGARTDQRDVIAAFAAKGYRIARGEDDLRAAGSERLLALLPEHGGSTTFARAPSLADRTEAALRVLAGEAGFVLLVEQEDTDLAGHANDIAGLMHALWAFDDAVAVALAFQRAHPDTLLVLMGDHETGGLSVTNAKTADGRTLIPGDAELRMIQGITLSLEGAGIALGEQPASEALDALVARHFPGFSLDAELRRSILEQRRLDGNFTNPTENALGRMVARRTGFYWGTSGHTTEAVAIGAIGPGAEGFRGYQDNTEFGKRLHALVGGAR